MRIISSTKKPALDVSKTPLKKG